MGMIRVLIADDHPLVRFAVRRCLEWEESVEVVGEASTGREAVALAREFRPDAVLLDYQMPVLDGVAAAQAISAEFPKVAILMLTGDDDDVLEEKASQAGVHRLIRKDEPAEALLRTLYEVLTQLRQPTDDRLDIVIEADSAVDRNS
jgi:two-component system nitrate/nitrite response regulator NarL